jgi:hypothetical protein
MLSRTLKRRGAIAPCTRRQPAAVRRFTAPSAAPAPAAAGDGAGRSDWHYILRASVPLALFGVPWWVLSQIRDDAEFRYAVEEALPAALPALRAVLPAFAPPEQPDCYRLCERPTAATAAAALPPPLPTLDAPLPTLQVSLRGARGSLETVASLRAAAEGARARAAAARAAAAAAAARAASGAASPLSALAAEDAADVAEADAVHAAAALAGWHARAWAPPPPPNGGAPWLRGWGVAPRGGGDGGEGALAADGGDEGRPWLWRRPPAVRAVLSAAEARAACDRLAVLRSGALAAELAAAEAAAPPLAPAPAPPSEEPWSLARALALLAPQPPPLDALVAAPAAVDVGALPRCVGCGAWGVGVMQAGGACAHCVRVGRLPVSPSVID